MLLCAVWGSFSEGANTQSSRDSMLDAIEAGVALIERPHVLAVATSAMVNGADCAQEPCWVAVHLGCEKTTREVASRRTTSQPPKVR